MHLTDRARVLVLFYGEKKDFDNGNSLRIKKLEDISLCY